ncbi:hypothetical protein GCM10010376_62180 [Streptomyces violaceusniger]
MVRSFCFTVKARSGEGARPLRGQMWSAPREDTSAVIVEIIRLTPPLAVVVPHPRGGGSAVTSSQAPPRPQGHFDRPASDSAQ